MHFFKKTVCSKYNLPIVTNKKCKGIRRGEIEKVDWYQIDGYSEILRR